MMKTLPHLPLHPETQHITQSEADDVFDVLIKDYFEQLKYIEMINDKGGAIHPVDVADSYFKIIKFIFDNQDRFPSFPRTELSAIDLMFELRRRYLNVKENLPEVRGRALAVSSEGPFPKSLDVKIIDKETAELGLMQAEVDSFLNRYYEVNQRWCYIQSEAWRRDLVALQLKINGDASLIAFYKQFSGEDTEIIRHKKIQRLSAELAERIRLTILYYTPEEREYIEKIKKMEFK